LTVRGATRGIVDLDVIAPTTLNRGRVRSRGAGAICASLPSARAAMRRHSWTN